MAKSSYSVFNLLVHYGPNAKLNFVDLLEDGVLETVFDSPETKVRKKEYFVENLSISKTDESIVLRGKFSKQFDFKSDRHKEEGQRKQENIHIEALPHAFFMIDLINHRVIWIKPSDITGAPSVYSFCTFLKSKIVETLLPAAYADAQAIWKSDRRASFDISKSKFISDYLKEQGVTKKTVTVSPIPLVDHNEIANLIMDEQFEVKTVRLRIHRPNATDREIEGAIGNFDQLAKFVNEKMNTDPELVIQKPGKEVIENKKEVVDVASKAATAGNVEIEIQMQNKDNRKIKKTIGTHVDHVNADIKYKKEVQLAPDKIGAEVIETIRTEVPSYDVLDEEKTINAKKAGEWLEKIRRLFPSLPFDD